MTNEAKELLFKHNLTTEELDSLASDVYDYCNARRGDSLNKDGTPGNPRKISSSFNDAFDEVKTFYRNVALWHLTKQ